MKVSKFWVIMAAMVILSVSLPIAASAETTSASVGFVSGQLEIIDPPVGQSGMNFDFDSHDLPIVAVTYPSVNGPHLFIVGDARSTPSGWTVTVSMSEFGDTAGPSTFNASITLKNPSDPAVTGIAKVDPFVIASDDTDPTLVMSATPDAGRGRFETEWTGADVELSIGSSEIRNIQPTSYEATLTWMLSDGPI